VTEEEGTPTEPTGGEQSGHHRDAPGREAEDASRIGSEDVPQSEAEVRARIEEQIRKLRVQDLMVESVVSVLNLTARRLAKEDERDLEQARVGIEAVRAWVDLLPEEAATQIRNALSELQMLYAQAVEDGGEGGGGDAGEPPAEGGQEPHPQRPSGTEPPPRLWTPPGSSN
jgi:hypothetical protein